MQSIEANRLTDSDRAAMQTRVRETLALWRPTVHRPPRKSDIGPDSLMALYRVAVHAIGCSDHDLREAELAERDAIVHQIVGELP